MLVVIDYDAGNTYNVGNALRRLGAEFVLSGDPAVVSRASRVILPGVGSASAAMTSLRRQGLADVIPRLSVPFLGICLGLQLLFERSDEENTPCLGVLPGTIRKFDRDRVKVPHIGWNRVAWASARPSPADGLLTGQQSEEYFYFVHSYYAPLCEATLAETEYDVAFSSSVVRNNFLGVQFHPERSAEPGLRLIENFLHL